jgi:putative oxidoreductase
MHTTTFKINWDMLSRIFIAALFVFAGYGKLMTFEATTSYIGSVLKTGMITPAITALVIFIEIVVAIVYAYGKYKKDIMAYILIAFTVLATIFFHSDMSNNLNVIMALKNLAIVGGLFATLDGVHKRRATN